MIITYVMSYNVQLRDKNCNKYRSLNKCKQAIFLQIKNHEICLILLLVRKHVLLQLWYLVSHFVWEKS